MNNMEDNMEQEMLTEIRGDVKRLLEFMSAYNEKSKHCQITMDAHDKHLDRLDKQSEKFKKIIWIAYGIIMVVSFIVNKIFFK